MTAHNRNTNFIFPKKTERKRKIFMMKEKNQPREKKYTQKMRFMIEFFNRRARCMVREIFVYIFTSYKLFNVKK